MQVEGFDPKEPVYWPPSTDGETPRYSYVGQLIGEHNFVPKSGARSNWQRFGEWVTGALFDTGLFGLARPTSVMTDQQGRIAVTDASHGALVVFDPAAERLFVWDLAQGRQKFQMPISATEDGRGGFFVSDSELAMVAHLSADGEPQAPLGKGVLKRPTGLVFAPEVGELFVADTDQHEIVVFDASTFLVKRRLGGRGEGTAGLNFPTYLSYRQGELLVADSMNARIAVLDAISGKQLRSIGERGINIGQLVRPKGVSVDSEGNLYVVESYHDHLLVFNQDGNLLLPIGGSGSGVGQFYLPAGVWVDPQDRVYVSDMFNGRIVILQFLGGDNESTARN